MAGQVLDEAELAALRTAISQSSAAQARPETMAAKQAVPVALIADDRAGESARPQSLKIAQRWATLAKKRLAQALRLKLELEVAGVELIQGALLRDELAGSWTRQLEVSGRSGRVLLAVSGGLIEAVAAILLGDASQGSGAAIERAPSAASIGVFARAGDVLSAALADAWQEEQSTEVMPCRDPSKREAFLREVLKSDSILTVTCELKGPGLGRARLIGRPETFVVPMSRVRPVTVSQETIEAALGDVEVEILVELGRARMKMSELARLQLGALITLQQATDALLPVRCAVVVKGFGRPVISRGAMAVEIVTPSHRGEGSGRSS